ncbi:class I SAM-dependent methyltransferase [Pseudomonas sp. LMG 31766]|nr:class I SAM-dependent methyltransferase [Pseudomonas chaetocerotis]MBZ9665823.1 class I SAM-dependent methyltransferase [Pseudomonas chaetocerotis]
MSRTPPKVACSCEDYQRIRATANHDKNHFTTLGQCMNKYGKLAAWVYHLDKPIGRSFGDLEYYQQRLAGLDGPILEPAVGNGRIFVPLLETGLAIEGFDASQEMLGHCRQECLSRQLATPLTCQMFDTFSYDKDFAAIIMPAGSFQLITDVTSALNVLKRFHDHLLPGGKMMLDIDPISSFFEVNSHVRSWKAENGDLLTLTAPPPEMDHVAQTSLSYLRYEHWRDGALMGTELDLFHLRWWGIEELAFALRAAGFTDIVVSGNYRYRQKPQKDSYAISFEASRPTC